MNLHFDIETAPNMDALRTHHPYPGLPVFDPDAVKVGNLKDAAKIAAKIEAERAKFAETLVGHEERHWEELVTSTKACLSPALGRICAVGYSFGDGEAHQLINTSPQGEVVMVELLAKLLNEALRFGDPILGWNITGFDLPFLQFRSRALGATLPTLQDSRGYWVANVIDLMHDVAGQHRSNRLPGMGLKVVAPAFGFPPNPEPDGGKHFWKHAQAGEMDRCRKYLEWDVLAVEHIAGIYPERIEALAGDAYNVDEDDGEGIA